MKQNPGNIIPPFLKEGDKVALVSPCYRLDPVKFQYAVEFLRGRRTGYRMCFGEAALEEDRPASSSGENRILRN